MSIISNYFRSVRSVTFKYITRAYVSNSSNRYKNLQGMKSDCSSEGSLESSDLSNGMHLVCDYRDSYTVALGCFVPAGSMHEKPEERGSALFLEHLLFRRTKYADQEQLGRTVEEIGARINAVAMRDIFLFYATAPSCRIKELIQLFADVILNGIICDADITSEKNIILHDLFKMELDKERVAMDYLSTIAYQDTALANSVYPNTDVIKTFAANSLTAFRNRLLKTCYMTMVCTGPIYLEDLQELVCKSFQEDDQSSSHGPQSCAKSLQYRFSGADLRVRDDDDDIGYVAIGIEGPSYKEYEDYIALKVAKQIVGSWSKTSSGINHNAPFLAHCSYNTDMCYMYRSFFHNWVQSTSIWGCYFVCDKLGLDNMLDGVQGEWMRLCTTITTKEVLRAVNECKTNELLSLNDPVNRFFDIVKNLFRYGNYKSVNERLVEYKKISTNKIREVADRYIYDQSPAVVALGRIENLPEYATLREGMYLYRY